MKRLCAGVLILASSLAAGAPGDFVRGRVVNTVGTQIVQRAAIPQDVYEWVSRADLGDLRVFNGEQAEVPYTLRRPTSQHEFSPWVDLPVFVLPSRDISTREGAQVSVQVDSGGAVVSVNSNVATASDPAGFLVDISGLDHELSELLVGWSVDTAGFIGKFRVDASNDLDSWRTVVKSTTLAKLETGGQKVAVEKIQLSSVRARYLKIMQLDGSDSVQISVVQARSRRSQLPPRQWKTLSGTLVEGGYEMETGGRFPLDRVSVEIEQDTFLVIARLFSKAHEEDSWRSRGQHTFYRVAVNDTIADSEPVAVSSGDRFWRVELANGDGQSPKLKFGWLPDEVVFLRQGPPPYLLAYGQIGSEGSHWPMKDLLSRLGADRDIDSIAPAELSAPNNLGGPSRLELPPEPIDWETIALWVVLVVGVGVIGLFAYRLVKASD
jgi:hypothetical protein